MASASSPFASTKETTNYARLCRLLVDVGSQALRSTFDKIHPPATLHTVLSSTSVHYTTLQKLKKGKKKVLNPAQWGKLYPAHSPASSATFDITLLTVLLRNICGLSPPATDWDNLPPATNTSIADDIARVKYYRNTVYAHAAQASVDDKSFSSYWQEIREALVRLGGAPFRADINKLEHDCMDALMEERYRELMKQWKKDDDSIKDKLEEMEESIKDSFERTRGTVEKNFRDTSVKIESEMKEVKEKLGTLTALVEEGKADEESMKDSPERIRSEMEKSVANMDCEMKEVKEKLDTLTSLVEKIKDKVKLQMRIDCETIPESCPQVGASGSMALASQSPQPCEQEMVVVGVKEKGVVSLASLVGGTEDCETAIIGSDDLPSSQKVMNFIALKCFETVDASKPEERNGFLNYMENVRKVLLLDIQGGSLIITVQCSSLEILDELWKDYCTGHLNEMAQKFLLTEDVLKKFGLTEVKLLTTIQEEDYRVARECFLLSPESIKDSVEQIGSEMENTFARMETEMKEVKEKLGSLTVLPEESKDEESIKYLPEQIRNEMENTLTKVPREMKEVKEKLGSLTASPEESKDEESIKDSVDQIRSEMENTFARMEREMKEVKEKLGSLTVSPKESKDEGVFDPSELRRLYRNREGWLAPFPWREFYVGDIFTRLKVVRRKMISGLLTDKFINMSSVLEPHEECSAPRTVLIEGKPGMGKTTYCKKYAYDWATGKQEPQDRFPRFKAVLLLKCRDIKSNFWEAIDDQLLPRDIDEGVKEQFFKFIRENQSSILLLLDGLDELPSSKLHMLLEVILGTVLRNCYILATARHEAGIELWNYFDTLLEIQGFTEERVREFITKYFKGRPDLAEKLSARMSRDENLTEMAANPLITTVLCLICEESEGILPENRTQLYLDIVECVLRRYRTKEGLPETSKNLTNVYKSQLKHLGLIAFNGLLTNILEIEESELENHGSDLPGFGFLSVQPVHFRIRPCLYYAFLHIRLQEFFAAFYICCQIQDKEIAPEELVSKVRYFSNLKGVLLFTCGILAVQCNEQAVALVTSIINQVNEFGDDGVRVVLEAIKECILEQSIHLKLGRYFGCAFKLQHIHIAKFVLGNALTVFLAEAIKVNKTLTVLNLSESAISDAGATSIAEAIKVNKTLTSLDLSFNGISDAGATSIAEAIKVNKTLTSLDLSGNRISDAGATSIAEAIKVNKTLTTLKLWDVDISDAGATSIAEAIN